MNSGTMRIRARESIIDGADVRDTLDAIVDDAMALWEKAGCLDDFCVQHVSAAGDVVVFGSVNRVVWSTTRGLRVEKRYCSRHFQEANAEFC